MKTGLFVLLSVCIISSVKAQDATDAEKTEKHSYGKFSLSYLSNSVYNGRKDSLAIPYLTASLGYYNKHGYYVNADLNYLAQSGNGRIDLLELTAGYNFESGNWEGDFNGFKSFYHTDSKNLRSSIDGGVSGYTAYDLNFIKPSIQAGLNFGTKTDYIAAIGLEHSFEAFDDNLEITPSFLANAGTYNYYGSYYQKRKFGRRKKTGSGTLNKTTVDVSDAENFRLQDYEFSLPVDYYTRNFHIGFIPTYAIPVNPATVSVQTTSSTGTIIPKKIFTEPLSNSFFFSIEISYKF
ncbi:hypothetical protein [Flavihumibacter profundi]|jgi:hypothetical protein|uniref:hypothetical protein n=1 Tax=Flavihumibacter profundi TaxID=2716883 RepID=UPI001CC4B8C6|nr:hypothetical protein [Flavihumibacter profundi]MBZ5858692.1 hypothetical protein [Flavihumibacter profundi]